MTVSVAIVDSAMKEMSSFSLTLSEKFPCLAGEQKLYQNIRRGTTYIEQNDATVFSVGEVTL